MSKQALLMQRHRAKNAEEGYARMEITLSRKFITQAREFARQRRMPFWYFVEQSLLDYAATVTPYKLMIGRKASRDMAFTAIGCPPVCSNGIKMFPAEHPTTEANFTGNGQSDSTVTAINNHTVYVARRGH